MDLKKLTCPLPHKIHLLAFATSIFAAFAAVEGPTPVVPEGGQPPGPYPNYSVSSANWIASGGNADDGNVDLGLEQNGPIPWAATRFNRGDIAVRLSPRDASAALGNLAGGFTTVDNATAAEAPGQVWTPSREAGVMIPVPRENGPVSWPDGQPEFFPTVAISHSSSGNGYDMVTGEFNTGEMEVNTGKAGTGEEGNFNFATTWFPYEQGWLGGDVGVPTFDGVSGWGTPISHSGGLAAGMVRWIDYPQGSLSYGGHARITLPGVNSSEDGMIFATSTDGSSAVNIVGVAPLEDGTGWLVTIREDSATDSETLAPADQSEFAFVYVPYSSANLVGGWIDGGTGNTLRSSGAFTVTRIGAGTYEATIPGKTGADGTLLLQAADFEDGTTEPLATRSFLSYEFADGKFTIQARKTSGDNSADLTDTDFYLAWIDFSTPLSPPEGPIFKALPTVAVSGEFMVTEENSIATSSDEPEVLVTFIDSFNINQYNDPITGELASGVLVGRFFNSTTFEATSEPFPIVGNPFGALAKNDVEYNPVTKQYVVVTLARTYNTLGMDTVLVALVNPASVAGENSPVAKTFAHDPETDQSYDDVSLAVSTANGNFMLLAERKFDGEGEGTVAALYDEEGTLLTAAYTRVDLLQTVGDEDDPEVIYLPARDQFLYIANTDNSNGSTGDLSNRIVGSLIDSTPTAQGALVVRPEQPLGDGMPEGRAEGHPSALLNPFNGQLITVYDGGNGTSIGEISYFDLGSAPSYTFTSAEPEIPYLAGDAGNPFQHQHPQLAVDENSGVILLGFNARGSTIGLPDGYAFIPLGTDGQPMERQLDAYYVTSSAGPIEHGVNYHTLKYSPVSDSFVVSFSTEPGVTYLAGVKVLSSHSDSEGPELNIAREGGMIVITWPAEVSDFTLQSTASLSAPDWEIVTPAPEIEGDLNRVELPPEGNARFFRLSRP